MYFEDFSESPESRWSYVADTVMGGVSSGQVSFEREGAVSFVRLRGLVSTDNNGGFIQVRTRFDSGLPAGSTDLSVTMRGNGQTYFVFLRSVHGTRPWHSYRTSFVAGPDWETVQLPFAAFEQSRQELPSCIKPEEVTGIGLVAYGEDFQADLSVCAISVR